MHRRGTRSSSGSATRRTAPARWDVAGPGPRTADVCGSMPGRRHPSSTTGSPGRARHDRCCPPVFPTGPIPVRSMTRTGCGTPSRPVSNMCSCFASRGAPVGSPTMRKIPRTDPRADHIATADTVDREGLVEFATGKHSFVLATTRRDGRPQMSLVTGTITPAGELLISTYPQRVKATNLRRDPAASVLVMGDTFNSAWVQIDGDAVVVDMPDAADALVEYYRCISGEHPDWDEYRRA